MYKCKIIFIILSLVSILGLCSACNSEDVNMYTLKEISNVIGIDFTSARYEDIVFDEVTKGDTNIFGEVSYIKRYSIDDTLCQTIINDKSFRKLPILDKNFLEYKEENSWDERLLDDPITEGYYCIINRTNLEDSLDTTTMVTEESIAVNYRVVYCDPENKKLYINTFNN